MNFDAFIQKIKHKVKNIPFRKPTPEEMKSWLRKSPKYIGFAGLAFFLSLFLFYQAVRFELLGKLPSLQELKSLQQNEASEIYSIDNVLLGRYYTTNRTTVDFKDISPLLLDALVAVEDQRFYTHKGVDIKSLPRVFVKSILFQQNTGGGSTITQQLAKNLFPRKEYFFFSTPINKVREMVVALRLEKIYTKDELITLYLNTVPFGEGIYGVKIATKRFFNTTPKNLTIEQAATLAGMLQAPSRLNPRKHPERAKFRRDIVLAQMEKYGYLQPHEVSKLSDAPLVTDYQFISNSDGLAPYFRAHLQEEIKDICATLKKPDGSAYNIYTDGLKIKTTIHSKWQQYAEEAVKEHMAVLQKEFADHWKGKTLWEKDATAILNSMKASDRYKTLKTQGRSEESILKNFNLPTQMDLFTWDGMIETQMSPIDSIIHYHSLLNTGFLATDPVSGEVRAWVGGINHHYLQYDHVKAQRQAGSIFKPIVYTAALQNGYTPCSFLPNEKNQYANFDKWSPDNADGKYGGFYSLKGGLANSVNTIAAQLIHEVGIPAVRDLAYRMGLKSELPEGAAIALGSGEVNLLEMAKIYGVFANRGIRTNLKYLVRIEDSNGKVIYEPNKKEVPKQVLSAEVTYQINEMLQGVVDSGTARALRYRYGLYGCPIGAKTGTTQDQADGRFMGFTPNFVGAVWVGGINRNVRFRSLRLGNGAHMALPIWGLFYKKMLADSTFAHWKFEDFPSSDLFETFDCKNFTYDEFEVAEQEHEDESFFDRLLNRSSDTSATDSDRKHPQRVREERNTPVKDWLEKQREKRDERKQRRRNE